VVEKKNSLQKRQVIEYRARNMASGPLTTGDCDPLQLGELKEDDIVKTEPLSSDMQLVAPPVGQSFEEILFVDAPDAPLPIKTEGEEISKLENVEDVFRDQQGKDLLHPQCVIDNSTSKHEYIIPENFAIKITSSGEAKKMKTTTNAEAKTGSGCFSSSILLQMACIAVEALNKGDKGISRTYIRDYIMENFNVTREFDLMYVPDYQKASAVDKKLKKALETGVVSGCLYQFGKRGHTKFCLGDKYKEYQQYLMKKGAPKPKLKVKEGKDTLVIDSKKRLSERAKVRSLKF